LVRLINDSDAEIVHLHWVCDELLSVEDIGRLRKPLVWTLHDMWAFCGAEHYSEDLRWRDGYTAENRPRHESGFDLNRWVWIRKRKAWRLPMHVVAPSNWLGNCARQSALMRHLPLSVVPNALDTDSWKSLDRDTARSLLGLPLEGKLLAFGAMGGGRDPRKGIDLLRAAIGKLRGRMSGLGLVVFGELRPRESPDLGFPVYYLGHLYDDLSLRALYSAADVLVIPSRQDNLPNTGVEALACGTPVLAFNVGGLPDIVAHEKTGWLAEPFDAESLAAGILWILADPRRHQKMRQTARQVAVQRYCYSRVARAYADVYETTLDN
jgi:glycosyltransferase involved in cell wall biosynthesis